MIDVTIDREKYIGGSDIPAIMGISPFKTRWQLLCEKAELVENEFEGNRYTEYGNILEPQIRAYINKMYKTKFAPSQKIKGDLRANTDGFNGDSVLEIKTTSQVHKTLEGYKLYLVQLLFYMQLNEVENGILAVYERPADFNPDFDAENLQIFEINAQANKTLTDEINAEIDRFRRDLERLRENPLLSEQDFQPTAVIELSREVAKLEVRMAEYKEIEKQYKAMKAKLFDAMMEYGVKSWNTPSGAKITRVDGTPASVKLIEEFDLEAFKIDNPLMYDRYIKEVPKETAGRAGFVKITLPKE